MSPDLSTDRWLSAVTVRTVALLELAFGWSDVALAQGSPADRRHQLYRKARALVRHDRILNRRPV